MALADALNVTLRGPVGAPVMIFVHGFGCGQDMWRHVAPDFESDYRVVLVDLPGSGRSDPASYDPVRHASLEGYRDDLAALLQELDMSSVVLVGHSVSAMIGVLLQIAHPDLVDRLVLIGPSARYLDDGPYRGGFSESDIDDLLALMSRNHLGWQDPLATLVAGEAEGEQHDELERSFCRTRPEIAAQFAAVTFRGDNRTDLALVTAPTLVVQSSDDAVAPLSAGLFVGDTIPGAQVEVVTARGHCPHLTAPAETAAAMARFLDL